MHMHIEVARNGHLSPMGSSWKSDQYKVLAVVQQAESSAGLRPACLSRSVFVVLDIQHQALAARPGTAQHDVFVALFSLSNQVSLSYLFGLEDHVEPLAVQDRLPQRM